MRDNVSFFVLCIQHKQIIAKTKMQNGYQNNQNFMFILKSSIRLSSNAIKNSKNLEFLNFYTFLKEILSPTMWHAVYL